MRFKIDKESPLYNSLVAIIDKCNNARAAAEDLALQYGAEKVATTGRYVAGGIDAFSFPHDTEPDKKNWRSVERYQNLWYPRTGAKNKQNKEIHEKIAALPVVEIEEFNDIIGFQSQFKATREGIGHFRSYGVEVNPEYCLITIDNACDFTPIDGMVEILETEYRELTKNK